MINRHEMLVLQIKHRLKLESRTGLRASHGAPKATTLARQRLGLKGNADSLYEQVCALHENLLATRQFKGAGLYNCCTNFSEPRWTDYDDFEVQACYSDPLCSGCIEPITDDSEMHLAEFWTVYGHLHDGGVEAITDTSTEALAYAILEKFKAEHWEEMQAAKQIRRSVQRGPGSVH